MDHHHPFTLQKSAMTPATQAAGVIAAGPGAVAERLRLDRARVAELEAAEACEVKRGEDGHSYRLADWHGFVTVERIGRHEFLATAHGPSSRGWSKTFFGETASYAHRDAEDELVAYLKGLRRRSMSDARERIALLTAEPKETIAFGPPADMETAPRSIDTVDRLASLRDRLDVMLADLAELDDHLADRSFIEHQCSPQGVIVSTEWWSVDEITGLTKALRDRVAAEITRLEEARRIIDEEDEEDEV